MVDNFVLSAQLWVLVLEGVEAVRTGDDNLALLRRDTVEDLIELFDVLLSQHLEEELVTSAASGITSTALSLGEHSVLHTGGVKHFCNSLGGLLRIVVVSTGTTDPEQVLGVVEALDIFAPNRDDDAFLADLVNPVGTSGSVLAPRVALGLEVLEQASQLGREVRLNQNLVAAHIDDVVDVLNVNRALLNTGTTVGAGPQDVLVDDALIAVANQRLGQECCASAFALASGFDGLASQQVRGRSVSVVTQLVNQQLRGQWLGSVPCRALLLAATTLSTRGEVQQSLPGVVGDHTGTHGVNFWVSLFQVQNLAVRGHRLSASEGVVAISVALEQDVGECQEAVPCDTPSQVAANNEEPDHTGQQLNQREDGHHDFGGRQNLCDTTGDEVRPGPDLGASVTVVAVGSQLGCLDEHHAEALDEDDSLDEISSTSIGAVEAAQTLLAEVGLADEDQCQDAQGGAQAEQFVDEVPGGQIPEDWPTTGWPEGLNVRLEPHQGAEEEAHHDEPVSHSNAGFLGHLGVTDDLSDHGPNTGSPFTGVTVCLLAHHDGLHHMGESLDKDEPAGQGQQDANNADCDGESGRFRNRRVSRRRGEVEHAHNVPSRLAQPG